MKKANFLVDGDFPEPSVAVNSDRYDSFSVRGGGSTNTTMLDPYGGAHFVERNFKGSCSGIFGMPDVKTPYVGLDPLVPLCINAPSEGDGVGDRCGDRVFMDRVLVTGVVTHPGFVQTFTPDLEAPDPFDAFVHYYAPRVFVAVALDRKANGDYVPPEDIWSWSTASVDNEDRILNLPSVDPNFAYRISVLAYDVVDFSSAPQSSHMWVPSAVANYPGSDGGSGVVSYVQKFTRVVDPCSKSFVLDVDLNGVLCRYLNGLGDISACADYAVHVYALAFDGFKSTELVGLSSCALDYRSRFFFRDAMFPSSYAGDAGVDGPVVPDEQVPLDVFVDAVDERIRAPRRKAPGRVSFGLGEEVAFDDDPEFASVKRAKSARSASKRRVGFPRGSDRRKAFKSVDEFDEFV